MKNPKKNTTVKSKSEKRSTRVVTRVESYKLFFTTDSSTVKDSFFEQVNGFGISMYSEAKSRSGF